jgi:hypothetical protein
MVEIMKIQAASLFPLVSEMIEKGQPTRIIVSGSSMYPFLRDGIDSVELDRADFERLAGGDIVMIQRTNGQYIMHRVCKKEKDHFFMVGDAQQWIEGPLYPEQLVAVATAIWRKERRIVCSNRWWKFLSGVWLLCRPCRYRIIKTYRRLRALTPKRAS